MGENETETETEATEPQTRGRWIAGTIGYVLVSAYISTVLANALQDFAFEKIRGVVTLAVTLVVVLFVIRSRRATWPSEATSENRQ